MTSLTPIVLYAKAFIIETIILRLRDIVSIIVTFLSIFLLQCRLRPSISRGHIMFISSICADYSSRASL